MEDVTLEPQTQPTQSPVEPIPPSKGDWARTRQCACPPTNRVTCQIRPSSETCPYINEEGRAITPHLRWLWARYIPEPVFDDVSSDPVEQVAEEMTKKLLRDVSGNH